MAADVTDPLFCRRFRISRREQAAVIGGTAGKMDVVDDHQVSTNEKN
jgi:hypothetical protein